MTITKSTDPIPPRKPAGRPKYPWGQLSPGDFYTIAAGNPKAKMACLSSAYAYAKRHAWKLVRRDQQDGSCRIYREA
jgi:hypothetical protein